MSVKYLNIIQEDSTPVYGWFWDFWDQADWIQWHKKLLAKYGLTAANERFLIAWNDSPLFSRNVGFRNSAFSENLGFIDYAKQNNFYDKLFSGVLGTFFQIQSTAIDATKDVTSAVGSVAESTKTISSYILPVALGLAVVFAFYYFKKHKLI